MELTKDQIKNKFQTEPLYALGFGIDNNPEGVLESLRNHGYTDGNDNQYAFNTLSILLNSGSAQKVNDIISDVHYLDNAPNYTAGFKDYFLRTTPPNKMPMSSTGRIDFNGLLAGLGAALSTYGIIASSTNSGSTGGGNGPTQAELDQIKKDADKKAEDEKKAKLKTIMQWGIGISISVLLFFGIRYFLSDKKKEDKAA